MLRSKLLFATCALAIALPLPALAETAPQSEVHAPAPAVLPVEAPAPDMSAFAIRHQQLTLHQGFGLATLASMAVTAGLGYYEVDVNPSEKVLDAHLLMAGLTTGLYLTSATLALTSPPNPITEITGPWDTANIHKNLAWLHGAGIVTTLGLGLASNYLSSQYVNYHAIAAYSTLSLMALSAGVIAFGE